MRTELRYIPHFFFINSCLCCIAALISSDIRAITVPLYYCIIWMYLRIIDFISAKIYFSTFPFIHSQQLKTKTMFYSFSTSKTNYGGRGRNYFNKMMKIEKYY